jgi:hypothetical protein
MKIIEKFIGTISDDEIREKLLGVTQERGAFRRFKDGVREQDVFLNCNPEVARTKFILNPNNIHIKTAQ